MNESSTDLWTLKRGRLARCVGLVTGIYSILYAASLSLLGRMYPYPSNPPTASDDVGPGPRRFRSGYCDKNRAALMIFSPACLHRTSSTIISSAASAHEQQLIFGRTVQFLSA